MTEEAGDLGAGFSARTAWECKAVATLITETQDVSLLCAWCPCAYIITELVDNQKLIDERYPARNLSTGKDSASNERHVKAEILHAYLTKSMVSWFSEVDTCEHLARRTGLTGSAICGVRDSSLPEANERNERGDLDRFEFLRSPWNGFPVNEPCRAVSSFVEAAIIPVNRALIESGKTKRRKKEAAVSLRMMVVDLFLSY